MAADVLNKKAIAKTVQGGYVVSGRVIAYCESPMLCIENQWTGEKTWWRVDLCQFPELKEEEKKAYGPF